MRQCQFITTCVPRSLTPMDTNAHALLKRTPDGHQTHMRCNRSTKATIASSLACWNGQGLRKTAAPVQRIPDGIIEDSSPCVRGRMLLIGPVVRKILLYQIKGPRLRVKIQSLNQVWLASSFVFCKDLEDRFPPRQQRNCFEDI